MYVDLQKEAAKVDGELKTAQVWIQTAQKELENTEEHLVLAEKEFDEATEAQVKSRGTDLVNIQEYICLINRIQLATLKLSDLRIKKLAAEQALEKLQIKKSTMSAKYNELLAKMSKLSKNVIKAGP